MITLKSDSDIQSLLDKPSFFSIIDMMKRDCVNYSQKFRIKNDEWIPRVIVSNGSEHEGSRTKYGFRLDYQFRLLTDLFDVGIREMRLAESSDEFLDLYSEIKKDPTIKNKQKGE